MLWKRPQPKSKEKEIVQLFDRALALAYENLDARNDYADFLDEKGHEHRARFQYLQVIR